MLKRAVGLGVREFVQHDIERVGHEPCSDLYSDNYVVILKIGDCEGKRHSDKCVARNLSRKGQRNFFFLK